MSFEIDTGKHIYIHTLRIETDEHGREYAIVLLVREDYDELPLNKNAFAIVLKPEATQKLLDYIEFGKRIKDAA